VGLRASPVTVLLVRHAVARDRDRWEEDDDLRPLTSRGRTQGSALVEHLADYEIGDVLSSPSLRCVDTVAPLADDRGLNVVIDTRLAEGNGHRAAKLVKELLAARADVALCSHGDVIPDVMEALGYDCNRCAKGSTWVLDGKRAVYLPPPA